MTDLLSPTRKQAAEWAKLSQKKFRRESGLFLIEGEVCVGEALAAKAVDCLLILNSEAERWEEITRAHPKVLTYKLTTDVFRRVSQVEATQGIAAVGKQFKLRARKSGVTLLCEQVSDPGNCGALIRVADFFGVAELVLGPGSADVWNEKVVRGSMGSLFHQPLREVNEIDRFVKAWKGDSIALTAHGGVPVGHKFATPKLLVLGNETRGISPEIEKLCTHKVTLTPRGQAESLNLVTAAAVFCYALSSV
ncbi:MAG: RNA methyltransferase [Calditrichaeota bacterium]|nr:RNA methyltransferase [Calditrichota bacterium]